MAKFLVQTEQDERHVWRKLVEADTAEEAAALANEDVTSADALSDLGWETLDGDFGPLEVSAVFSEDAQLIFGFEETQAAVRDHT